MALQLLYIILLLFLIWGGGLQEVILRLLLDDILDGFSDSIDLDCLLLFEDCLLLILGFDFSFDFDHHFMNIVEIVPYFGNVLLSNLEVSDCLGEVFGGDLQEGEHGGVALV